VDHEILWIQNKMVGTGTDGRVNKEGSDTWIDCSKVFHRSMWSKS